MKNNGKPTEDSISNKEGQKGSAVSGEDADSIKFADEDEDGEISNKQAFPDVDEDGLEYA